MDVRINFNTLAPHLPLALAVAFTGVVLPIALFLTLLHGAYGYPLLTVFVAGAALCSPSLGTTVSLFAPPLRKTIEDAAGLVIAGTVAPLAASSVTYAGTALFGGRCVRNRVQVKAYHHALRGGSNLSEEFNFTVG